MKTNTPQKQEVKKDVSNYNEVFDVADYKERSLGAQRATDSFYTLVTEIYERGWGDSFHFGPRKSGEKFKDSIVRHEQFLAKKLDLNENDIVLDVGCGVMGPARNIARFSGAKITGLTINQYQINRCNILNSNSDVAHLLDVKQGDFMEIPFPDATFDKIFAIEALCHAPDLVGVYKQIYKKLKPGGRACLYEWGMTDKYDPHNPEHVRIKQGIEYGNSICELNTLAEIDRCLDEAGFIKDETVNLATADYGNDVPWFSTIKAGWSFAQLRHTKLARTFIHMMLTVTEAIGLVPNGMVKAHKILVVAADSLVEAGKLGIFTPMYMVCVRKKED